MSSEKPRVPVLLPFAVVNDHLVPLTPTQYALSQCSPRVFRQSMGQMVASVAEEVDVAQLGSLPIQVSHDVQHQLYCTRDAVFANTEGPRGDIRPTTSYTTPTGQGSPRHSQCQSEREDASPVVDPICGVLDRGDGNTEMKDGTSLIASASSNSLGTPDSILNGIVNTTAEVVGLRLCQDNL